MIVRGSYLTFISSLIPLFDKLELKLPVSGVLLTCDSHPVISGVDGLPHWHYVPVSPTDPGDLWTVFSSESNMELVQISLPGFPLVSWERCSVGRLWSPPGPWWCSEQDQSEAGGAGWWCWCCHGSWPAPVNQSPPAQQSGRSSYLTNINFIKKEKVISVSFIILQHSTATPLTALSSSIEDQHIVQYFALLFIN